MKKGFTLVELAIVMVIIGLLVGGVVAASSMSGAAKITGQIAQIQQFDAAVQNFKSQYRFMPGDAPAFGGDGNGVISLNAAWGCCPGYLNTYGSEMANFWNHIFPDQYVSIASGGFVTANKVTEGPLRNVPLAKMGSQGAFFIAAAAGGLSGDPCQANTPVRNYYSMLTAKNIADGAVHNDVGSPVQPVDAAAMDQKIDDGNAAAGNVRGGMVGYSWCDGSKAGMLDTPPWDNTCSTTAGNYQIANKANTCSPMIRIGAQVKDPM